MSIETFRKEVSSKNRFQFGKNWKKFLNTISEERVVNAEKSLKAMLGVDSLKGKSFLDIGCGSGLFSLAAKNLGARVVSFDFDEYSVECTQYLKSEYYADSIDWTIHQGSALDSDFLRTLGQFDVVYSWGVLHHTGSMWDALSKVDQTVKKNGSLFIAIYNDQGGISKYWSFVKYTYNKFILSKPFWIFIHLIYPIMPSQILRFFRNEKPPRGMTVWYDLLDWLGGYPFEVARPEEIVLFYQKNKYQIVNLKTVGGKMGCNEFVFTKNN